MTSQSKKDEAPLEGWKEIGTYLQRTERTAKRWEQKEGLPVHRHRHSTGITVYAYRNDLDAWRAGRRPTAPPQISAKWWRPVSVFASTVAVAIALLTAGAGPRVDAADGGDTPGFRKIQIPTGLGMRGTGKLSPDGETLAFISDGSLWTVPVQGKSHPDIAGAPLRLTQRMDAWDVANVSIEWSGDGNWIGFRVAGQRKDSRAGEELFVVPVTGVEPRRLPITWKDWVGDVHTLRYSFSRDARTLYFAAGESPEELRIYSMPASGGDWQPLTEPTSREPALSPDGSRLVYLKAPSGEATHTLEVWAQPTGGGEPVLICKVAEPVWLRSPIWSPDGRMIAFLSSEGTNGGNRHRQIWVVRFSEDGRTAAPPTKIDLPGQTSDLLAGWTVGNKIGVLIPSPQLSALYTVPSAGGKATQLTPKDAWMPSWAPDGKSICFDGTHKDDYAGLECIAAEGGEVTRLPIAPGHEYMQPTYPTGGLAVSPDGKSLLFSAFFRRGEGDSGIFRLPAEGGQPIRLDTGNTRDREPAWSPDGRRIAFVRPEQGVGGEEIDNIWVMAVDEGRARQVTTAGDKVAMASIRWSPDGEFIAFYGGDRTLRVVPAGGGKSRIVVSKVGGGLRWQGLDWSPDGEIIAYVTARKIWLVPKDGGEATSIESGLDARISKIDWSPDGKTIAFVATTGGEHELWLLEDFLPAT